jgi:hypothetical protein
MKLHSHRRRKKFKAQLRLFDDWTFSLSSFRQRRVGGGGSP